MENDTAPKRPGKAKRLLRGLFLTAKWLFVLLLAMLLIAGLIFKAPWKVNTLLTILIITPTIIPRSFRKYIYITFALVLATLTIWIFLPEDDTGWRPYTLDDEIAEYRARYAVPDDQNAAVIYQELLETYDGERFNFKTFARLLGAVDVAKPKTFYPDFWNDELANLTLLGPWSSSEHPDMANWLDEKHPQTVDALIGASQKRFCRLEVTFDSLDLSDGYRLSALKDWINLLVLAGNNAWGDGQIDDAVTTYLAALKTAELWLEYPPNGPAVGAGLIAKLSRPLSCFIMDAPLTNGQLLHLEEALQEIQFDWQNGWLVYFDQERLEWKNWMLGYIYEVNEKGKTRFRRMPGKAILQSLGIEKTMSPGERRLERFVSIINWFWIPSSPKKAALAFDRAFAKYEAIADPDYNWEEDETGFSWKSVKLNFDYFADSIYPSTYHRLHKIYYQVFASARACRILIALKEYENGAGDFPPNLESVRVSGASEILVDPINGGEFVYRLTDDGFTLYSKGENGVDDGGVRDWDTGADDVLFWPVGE